MARAGYSGYLYFSEDKIDHYPSGTGSHDYESIRAAGRWTDIDDTIDVTPSSDRETIETTTRKLARAGKKGELEIYNSGSLEFTVSSELITATTDPVYKLIKAGLEGNDVSLLDLSDAVTKEGAFGTAGLYRLSRAPSAPKQLKSHQVLTFTATLQDWSSNVIVQTGVLIDLVNLA